MKPEPRIVVGKPHKFGWLRRSEYDSIVGASYFEAWERPDGGIVRIPGQGHDKPIEMLIAVRKRSPRGTAQAISPSRLRV